ncbi:protein of unknown function [Candidatus Methylocalor cossyra]|uniref:Uncharacterized protein n=1 Tax=Candidatus Methylocalor cossyra TaxID=3108543 RepID=A0ABM9NIC6_9GAMM
MIPGGQHRRRALARQPQRPGAWRMAEDAGGREPSAYFSLDVARHQLPRGDRDAFPLNSSTRMEPVRFH